MVLQLMVACAVVLKLGSSSSKSAPSTISDLVYDMANDRMTNATHSDFRNRDEVEQTTVGHDSDRPKFQASLYAAVVSSASLLRQGRKPMEAVRLASDQCARLNLNPLVASALCGLVRLMGDFSELVHSSKELINIPNKEQQLQELAKVTEALTVPSLIWHARKIIKGWGSDICAQLSEPNLDNPETEYNILKHLQTVLDPKTTKDSDVVTDMSAFVVKAAETATNRTSYICQTVFLKIQQSARRQLIGDPMMETSDRNFLVPGYGIQNLVDKSDIMDSKSKVFLLSVQALNRILRSFPSYLCFHFLAQISRC